MEDSGILELYFLRNEQALRESDRKYGAYCGAIAYGILQNREDTEETVTRAPVIICGEAEIEE